eukprot:gb/GFBE01021631.1/.p1 GENE.gb/GFBE01021631.1/~~gb/GFBE01021631.1/.p1  ORF type:complete len:335 (+),score=50.33 gb/GFBE01021631.1/:1-1005(+)
MVDGIGVSMLRDMIGGPQGHRNTVAVSDFSSDVGRKKFGFSHEDIDDGSAYYEGQFKLYLRCGQGTLQNNETGAKYVGQFQADKFHGKGDHLWPDGSRYIGDWHSGRKHGEGEYTSADNLKYKGGWNEGRRHGQGCQEYANGDRYEGSWFQGQVSGLGTYHFADGSQYQGAWSQGRYEGIGIMYSASGDRERLTYSHGLLMKREVLPPGPVPEIANRAKPSVYAKILYSQDREALLQPTLILETPRNPFLIKRDVDIMTTLTAPALRTPRPKGLTDQATPALADRDKVTKQIEDLLGPSQSSVETYDASDRLTEPSATLDGGPSQEFTFFTSAD